jgi:hypothetical protein
MDLVSWAGFDVTDWANFKGGARKAATNPKYCYEWVFVEGEQVIVNLWYEELQQEKDSFRSVLNPLGHPSNKKGIRKARARRMYDALAYCHTCGIFPRVIILRRSEKNTSSVGGKYLDNSVWTVTEFDPEKGEFTLERGRREGLTVPFDPDLEQFEEGKVRFSYVKHRTRENALRRRKIDEFIAKNGRVFCEVPGCGFDFYATYGEIGSGFAHVHHKTPLSEASKAEVSNSINDLNVVCPICHAMIHRGGECRPMESLIQRRASGDVH